jgi:hypothetical protein|tara:strand:+ start:369 stop:557 length:189 start_codon:yes stop_codon:yes gene_type:complete
VEVAAVPLVAVVLVVIPLDHQQYLHQVPHLLSLSVLVVLVQLGTHLEVKMESIRPLLFLLGQ